MKKKSTVNKAGNYTKPTLRKRIFQRLMNSFYGTPSGNGGRKAQALARLYRKRVGVIDNGFKPSRSLKNWSAQSGELSQVKSLW